VPTALRVRFGLNLADEGFLWYGAQRTLAGEVPLRDFMAYDPGRYQWTALWMWVVGDDGIVVTRWAVTLFEALAVGVSAVAIWRETRDLALTWFAMTSAVLLMQVWHARYEPSAALLQLVILSAFVVRPRGAAFFAGGLQVGLGAWLGRNLGLYGLIGLLALLALMQVMHRGFLSWRRLALLAAGGVAGFLPLVATCLLAPGFGDAFWQSLVRHVELGTTNIRLPVPWPWLLQAGDPWSVQLGKIVRGTLFLLAPLLGTGVVVFGLLRRPRLLRDHPLFTSAAVLSLPYAHYIYSRADPEHLQRGGMPLVLALALLPVARGALRVAAPAATLVVVGLSLISRGGGGGIPEPDREIVVGSDRLRVTAEIARTVEGARSLVERFVAPGETVFIAPFDVTLYPALGLRAPHWEIYPILPASASLQRAELARLDAARARLAIISLGGTDGQQELSFVATHALIANHLQATFVPVSQHLLPERFIVALRRQ
jgi:hypothetical protein